MHTPFLDFHTHAKGCERYLTRDDILVIQSLHLDEPPHPRANFVTLGIHPMLSGAAQVANRYLQAPQELLTEWCHTITLSTTPVIAIGECGWDHRSPLTLPQQDSLVDFHITLSEQLRLPLIFHIVGGWHYLLAKKKSHPTTNLPWIVHGFRGKPALAQQLTNAGIHLSLHPYCTTPPTPYLLETDDTSVDIQTHYQERGLSSEAKKADIINLFCRLFPTIYQ